MNEMPAFMNEFNYGQAVKRIHEITNDSFDHDPMNTRDRLGGIQYAAETIPYLVEIIKTQKPLDQYGRKLDKKVVKQELTQVINELDRISNKITKVRREYGGGNNFNIGEGVVKFSECLYAIKNSAKEVKNHLAKEISHREILNRELSKPPKKPGPKIK